ncbi:hypothetical protein BX616_005319 [Lobosporangium transversale]|nr:hypothetical protein BX616_005319 [Lobosporangium transversale]
MDSDAVLQAIALGLPNIYVVRQDAIFNPAIVVSIDKFMRILEEQFPGQSNRVRLDFCALCLFRGNDYLRGLAVRLEQLWKAYLFTKLIDPTIQGLRTGIEAETGEHQFLIDAKFKTFDLLFLKQLILNSYKDPKKLQLSPDPAQQDQTTLKSKRWPRKQKPRPDPESTQPNQPSIPIITKKNAGLTSNVHVDIVQDQVYGHDSDKESIDKSEGPENDVSDDDSGDIEALRATTNIDNYDAANEKEEEGVQEEEEEKDECEEEEEEEEDNGNSSKRFLSDDPIALKSPRSSVKKFLEGILWNLEMYCSGTCPDVSFRYEYHCAPPRRAVIAYIDSIMDPSKDTYKDLVPSTTVRLLNVTRTAKKYLHPLVCGLILLPVDGGAAYLPQSIAAVHTQIVSVQSPDVHLSQDEMEAIDAKVKHLIEILQSSDKNQDAAIAQELADLYDTRSPYIWTRVRRLLNQHAKPTAMPHSPSFIIQQLQDPSITFDQTQTLQFSHLEFQPDIIRSLVKVPPKTASYTATTTTTTMTASKTAAQDLSQDAPLQQNNIDTNISVSTTAATTVATGILLPSNQIRDPSAPWAVEARQDAITKSGKAPPIQWPFHYIHRNGNMRQRRLAGHGHIAHGHVHGPPSHHFHSHDKHQHGYHQAQQPQPFTLLSKAQQPNSMLEAQQPTSAPTSQQPTSQPKQHRRHLQRPPSRRPIDFEKIDAANN